MVMCIYCLFYTIFLHVTIKEPFKKSITDSLWSHYWSTPFQIFCSVHIIFGYIYSKLMRIPILLTSSCFHENISSPSSIFTFISNYLYTVQFVSFESLWENNCCTMSREGLNQCKLIKSKYSSMHNDPEILIGFKMSNYITAFLYRSFWVKITHFFNPASHNYSSFICALTSFFT
jgi:hypothetical protein